MPFCFIKNGAEKNMLVKICGKCGVRYLGDRCKCRGERHKSYDRNKRNKNTAKIYRSSAWQKVREQVKASCNGLDLYALKHKRIVIGTLVHHIIPADEAPELALERSNLILVSAATHAIIHAEYEKGLKEKKMMQNKLFSLINSKLGGGLGG